MQGVRRTATIGLAAALLVPLAGAAAGAAIPNGCDLDAVVGPGPEDPIELTSAGVSADGNRIIFSSTRNHTGGNADGSDEIFLYDIGDDAFTQLTDTPLGGKIGARFADSDSLVVFAQHTADDSEIHAVDVDTLVDTVIYEAEFVRLSATASEDAAALFLAGPDQLSLTPYRWDDGTVTVVDGLLAPFKFPWNEAALSPDGEITVVGLIETNEIGRPFTVAHDVSEEGELTALGRASNMTVAGPVPTLFATNAPPGPFGTVPAYSQVDATELDDLDDVDRSTAAAGSHLRDAGAGADHLIVTRSTTPPEVETSSARVQVSTGRVVPLGGRLNQNTFTDFGLQVSTDADATTTAFVSQNRLIVAECSSFSDVRPSQPFAEDIEWAFAEGITTGSPDGSYRPANEVSREAMAAFLHRLTGQPDPPPPAAAPFSDVALDHPFLLDIQWAVDQGITSGFADGTYRPKQPVRRDAMAAILHRVAGDEPPTLPGEPTYSDVPATHTFYEDIEWASAEGITTGFGDGTYRPASVVTRAAMAAFLHRTDEHLP